MGSQFAVHLPLERYLQEIPAPITEEQTAEVKADSINILVIDDDEIFLNFTAEILQRTGIQVYKCSSAVQAIKLLEEHSADLIITDIQMPTMNGLDLLAYLQRKTGKHIPVIAVTGEAVLNPEGVTLAASLKKPFVPDELLGLVGKILQRRISSPVSALAEHSHSLDEKKSDEVGYTLDQIRQFALNDPQSIHRILTSFVESSYENLALFEKHVLEKDRVSLSELAHKMLAMFRQIEAEKIVAPLMNLERYDRLSDEEWEELGRQTFKKIERFIENICENHGIYIRM
jgi:hypothetical protein